MKLSLSQDDFENLHAIADGRSEKVTVKREALAKLLLDHSRTLRELRTQGVITEQEELPRKAGFLPKKATA